MAHVLTALRNGTLGANATDRAKELQQLGDTNFPEANIGAAGAWPWLAFAWNIWKSAAKKGV